MRPEIRITDRRDEYAARKSSADQHPRRRTTDDDERDSFSYTEVAILLAVLLALWIAVLYLVTHR